MKTTLTDEYINGDAVDAKTIDYEEMIGRIKDTLPDIKVLEGLLGRASPCESNSLKRILVDKVDSLLRGVRLGCLDGSESSCSLDIYEDATRGIFLRFISGVVTRTDFVVTYVSSYSDALEELVGFLGEERDEQLRYFESVKEKPTQGFLTSFELALGAASGPFKDINMNYWKSLTLKELSEKLDCNHIRFTYDNPKSL